MTVSTTSNRVTYTGDGASTAFSFPYKFISTADIKVYVGGVLQTTGYTVGTPADNGAFVTFATAPASAASIVILADPARTQSTSLPTTGPFPAKSVETMVDKLTLLVQRLYDLVGRSITLADGDSSTASTNLPTPTGLQLIGWNQAGTALQNYDSASLAGAVAIVNWQTQYFDGDGVKKNFTLNNPPGVASNCDVVVGGVPQGADMDFTLSNAVLTFAVAPPVGVKNIAVRYGSAGTANTPADGSVTTAKFQASAKAPFSGQADTALALASAATTTTQPQNSNNTKFASTAYADRAGASHIQTVGATVSSNAMTISAGQLSLDFRDPNLSVGAVSTVVGTPANITIPAGVTLGTVAGVQSELYVVALNNAGTIELGVVNYTGGIDLSETGTVNTSSFASAVTLGSSTANTIYSSTGRANVAYRVIGLIRSTQATPGNWANNPTLVQGAGGNALDSFGSMGHGQTWQNVTATRSTGTIYYNTTGKPITVCVTTSSAGIMQINVNGVVIGTAAYASGNYNALTVIIPAGASYSATPGGAYGFSSWVELR